MPLTNSIENATIIANDIEIPNGILSENKYLNIGYTPFNISLQWLVVIQDAMKTMDDAPIAIPSFLSISLNLSLVIFLRNFKHIFLLALECKSLSRFVILDFERGLLISLFFTS